MNSANQMSDLYDRLAGAGYKREFLCECVLPEWWSDELAAVPANRAYVELLLSRQLGLELSTLADKHAQLRTRSNVAACLKRKKNVSGDQLSVAQTLAWRVATAAALSIERPFCLQHRSAQEIRDIILRSGAPAVGLPQLLSFCWNVGIPVAHLRSVPPGQKGMDGMATWTENRPAIVVASARQRPAWHLFILAHELGHIACGHIREGQMSVDDSDSVGKRSGTKEETEANEFAVELLAGTVDTKSYLPGLLMKYPRDLAGAAESTGRQKHIDPGFIVLSYCHSHSRQKNVWQVGQSALNCLLSEKEAADRAFGLGYSSLSLDELPEDTRRVFECLTKAA